MVVASTTPVRRERVRAVGVPVIDLSRKRAHVSELIVRACEEFGFFKVINHGVPAGVIAKMEAEGLNFFSQPAAEKQQAGPANPLGYGSKTIGFNGDTGEVEYLLLHTNRFSTFQRARSICKKDPVKFSCIVREYVEAMRELTREILEMLGEGLGLVDTTTFSRLVRDTDSDSLLRLNHYPPANKDMEREWDTPAMQCSKNNRIGFGEHSDPQILTLLRSNGVGGLQIMSDVDGATGAGGGVWVPVAPDPTAFCVNVGDVLQVLTNGRFVSVRHRVMANSYNSRLSMIYFGAPPLHARIAPLPEMVTPQRPCLYRPFTWAEYKKEMYSLSLGNNRLDFFGSNNNNNDREEEEEEEGELTWKII